MGKNNTLKIVLIGIAGWSFYQFLRIIIDRMLVRMGVTDELWQSGITVLAVVIVLVLVYKKTNVFQKIIGR